MTDGGFTVRLHRSGQMVRVARSETIVAALRRIGVRVPTSCRTGICGVCETKVISGIPLHRDQILPPQATASIMVCCSRSITPELILDL